MNIRVLKMRGVLCFIVLVGGLLASSHVYALDATESEDTTYHYYQNGKKLRIWLRADMVASFAILPAALTQEEYLYRTDPQTMLRDIRQHFPEASLSERSRHGSVGLYHIPVAEQGSALVGERMKAAGQSQQEQKYRYEPVFTSTQGGKHYLAPTNGVFVKFAADWTEERIQAWLVEHDVEPYRLDKILINNVYLIDTDNGMGSISLANRLWLTG